MREYLKERNKIAYTTQDGSILLVKGSPETMLELNTVERLVSTTLTGRMKGDKSEIMDVDWWVARDIAGKYLQEIEALRGK